MASQLQVSETISSRTVETEVVKNVGIPSRLPSAERVVSVNARLEIVDIEVSTERVIYNGIIRSTIFYAPVEEDSNVVSIRRNFNFTEQIPIAGARPGQNANIDALITDISFYIIDERQIGVEYIISGDIEVTAAENIEFAEEDEVVNLRREQIRISREMREREFTRELNSIERLDREEPDLQQIIDVESTIQISETSTSDNIVFIRGRIRSDVLYYTTNGELEFTTINVPLSENFTIRGVTEDMAPFIEADILNSNANKIDNRRLRIQTTINFKILVVSERVVEVPTGIISPEGVFPIRRTILVDRVVAEERTRIQVRGTTDIEEGNPDIDRVISASGRLSGPVEAETESGGVSIEGNIESSIIYVADLPEQPVYFASTRIPFNYFFDIPGVNRGMDVEIEAMVVSTRAEKIDSRQLRIRATLEINVLVTEKVRVPVVTGISDTPVEEQADDIGLRTYTVKSGDSLYSISRQFNIDLNQLAELNNITDPGNLQIGQQIVIPD